MAEYMTYSVSEKRKANVAGIVGLVGVIIALIPFCGLVFGDFWSRMWAPDGVTMTTEGYLVIIALTIGIAMATLGLGVAVRAGKRGMKEAIGDFANQVLRSKGKVSLKDIADHVKMGDIKILETEYLKPMIEEGYFENVRYENGWLIRDVIPCPYCSEPVKSTDKKCPNCGANLGKIFK